MWKIYQWTIEYRNYSILAILRGPEQFSAITHKEKYKTLKVTLYQEPFSLSISIEASLLYR